MSITITSGASVITPYQFGIYRSTRAGGTRVHEIPGAEFPDYTLRPAAARRGSMTLWFETAAASEAAEVVFSSAGAFTLVITENPTADMTFVVPDTEVIDRYQEPSNPDLWAVSVGFHEVAP